MRNLRIFLGACALGAGLVATSCLPGGDPAAPVPETALASTQKSEGSGPALDRGTAFLSVGEHEVVINYGRPALDGRDMLSQVKPGDIWRLGMNEATELESTSDLVSGGHTIPAGRYTLFARYREEDNWELVFNRKTGQWGAFEHDPGQDAGVIPLLLRRVEESIDRLTIALDPLAEDSGRLTIAWGTSRLSMDFQLK